MVRRFLASILTLAFLALLALARPSARQSSDRGPIAPGDDRRAIIDRIKANQERVRKLLGANDSGDQTRKLQRQIADDLAKLLEAPDEANPNPPAAGAHSAQPGQRSRSANQAPKPAQKTGEQMATPQGDPTEAKVAAPPAGGFWRVDLPPRIRQEVEAYPRDRLMPRYEELLRAYYRTIAESASSKKGDQP